MDYQITFGTDGWRALLNSEFNDYNVVRCAEALAQVLRASYPLAANDKTNNLNTIYVGYDTRQDAQHYAKLVGQVLADHNFKAVVASDYCPTPCLCWTVARDASAIAGVMLTASHNPAEFLGIKLRMPDGGASPQEFSDKVEAAIAKLDKNYIQNELALCTDEMLNNSVDFKQQDIATAYLENLLSYCDRDVIEAAHLSVVVDPLFGAGRGYLAGILRSFTNTQVTEIHDLADPSFGGLHPEPIFPWIDDAKACVLSSKTDLAVITDGDADRIGAIDERGRFLHPGIIMSLIIRHLVQNKRQKGRVVRSVAGTNILKRVCAKLNIKLTTTPIGFKWIYAELLKGDCLIGGEESGGIGIPSHVLERDGLLSALLLCEIVATEQRSLGTLVDELYQELGYLEYKRHDLRLEDSTAQQFVTNHIEQLKPLADYAPVFANNHECAKLQQIDRQCGIKFEFADDSWLLLRASGTESIVRVYAEGNSSKQVEVLLALGADIVKGARSV